MPLTIGNERGDYVREIPASYTGHTPMPVILDFHGYDEPASVQVVLSGLGTLGAMQGFVTITPEISHPDVPGAGPLWNTTLHGPDLRWVGGLLNTLDDTLCVDRRRVFATGYSNGAFLSSAIACQYSNRVAAVAPVAGIETSSKCHPSRAVPVVAFHGTADPLVLYRGGPGAATAALIPAAATHAIGPFGPQAGGRSIQQNTASWAHRNHCSPHPTTTHRTNDVNVVRYHCRHNASVQLYVVKGGGHTWPGSAFSAKLAASLGHTTFSISADDIMWAFFESHPLATE